MNSLEALVERWKSEEVDALPPASEEQVHLTFSKLGLRPTDDIVRLYGAIGGMEMMDNEYWRLWPLSEIEDRSSEISEYGALFSDYCLDCWAYRLKPKGSCSIKLVGFSNVPPLKSIRKFATLILCGP